MCRSFLVFLGLALICAASTQTESERRVIGGIDAEPNAFPFLASLRLDNVHYCGGSVLDEYWILTAAHCLPFNDTSNITVVLGSNSLSGKGDCYDVDKAITHEFYSQKQITNDIALIKVKTPIQFSEKVKPIKLPTRDTIPGILLTASGWGLTDFIMQVVPDKIQTIKLRSITKRLCKAFYGDYVLTPRDTNLCTLSPRGKGVCKGDSGGPLVNGDYVVGITSWASPCAVGKPDVFTRVYLYVNWIRSHTC